MRIRPEHIVILGAGESGTGAALLAKARGLDVFVSDSGKIKPNYKEILQKANIRFEEGGHNTQIFNVATEIIKSPGIPDEVAVVKAALNKGLPVISEIEFAARFTQARIIAITGSNGKTTTTGLLGHIMKQAGLNAGIAGNIGESFARQVATNEFDYYALELSSFQLDGVKDFRADIAILLNITPDHLDRYHHSFEAYADTKMSIIHNQRKTDAFIWCSDDETINKRVKKTGLIQASYRFSLHKHDYEGAYLEENKIIFNIKGEKFAMTLEELALQGKHNIYDSMAAGIAAKLIGLRKESIKQSMSDFQNAEHRLEFVANIHGITFINDSKATNINSAWYALDSQHKPVVWIAGGIDKGNDYTKITGLVKERVKSLICLGIDNHKMVEAFKGIVPVILEASSMEDAINLAYLQAQKDDVVLLSPACASFDLFENYEDRGRQFKNEVNKL